MKFKKGEIYVVNCKESILCGRKIRIVDTLYGNLEYDYVAKICDTNEEVKFGRNSYFAECMELIEEE